MSAKRRRLPFVGRPPRHGVSRHRRDIPLAESTQLNIVLTALYVLFAVVYLRSADGLFDGTGNVIGRDFINLWSAGTLSATGHLIDIFDYAAYHPLQEQLFGRELPPHNWSYPPHMLLIAAPLAWLPYIWALALWSLLTLGAYLLATRRLALLIAPATFINFIFGQTGCLVAALLIGALRLLDRRPVLAGVLFGLASIKPQLGLLIPIALLAARAWRTMASAGLTVVTMVVLSGQVFGWEAWRAYVNVTAPFQTGILENGTGLFTLMMPSAFMGARLIGLAAGDAYLVQIPFTLLATGATYWAFCGQVPKTIAFAILLLSTTIATPYIHNYDMTLISPAVLILLACGRRGGFRVGERLVWLLVWVLPIMVMPLNGAGLPIGFLVLSAALGFAIARLNDQRESLYPNVFTGPCVPPGGPGTGPDRPQA